MDRFFRQVEIDPGAGCWNWIGPLNNMGYGKFSFANTSLQAHRFSYEMVNGELGRGKVVRHTCDNPKCVNPDHLVMGTHSENTQDMYARQRAPNAKLNPDLVRSIRRLRNETDMLVKEIAEIHCVTPRAVEAVLSGQNWAWVV